MLPKESKTHIDNLVKAIDPFWTKINQETQTAFKALTEARGKLAAANPNQDKEKMQAIKGDIITKAKTPKPPQGQQQVAPKLKIKAGAQITPNEPKKSESSESESEES